MDYIVIGQGLAGSAVAIQLIKRRKSFVIIDQPERNISSRVAAGLFTPVTGQKMVKTWFADKIFPYLFSYYSEVEKSTGQKFFFPMSVYRPFSRPEQQNEWMTRTSDPVYAPYLEDVFSRPAIDGINDTLGGVVMKQCGFLNTTDYIRAARILIHQHGTLLQDEFHEEQVQAEGGSVRYGNYQASKMIFCHGPHPNKWFGWLPVKALKGETLSIRTNFSSKMIINRGVYMIPGLNEGEWRVGSTYDFHDHVMDVTEKGRNELIRKVQDLISLPFEVTHHEWGVRPTTHDRRPILGAHPGLSSLVVFNGLGTKGVSLAPYFSAVLIDWLENGGSLIKDVDIERFKSLYSNSPR